MRIIVFLLCAAISPVLWVLLSCGSTARCGDGSRGPSPGREGCDDGNTLNGDTCSSTCQPVPFLVDGDTDDFEWLAYPEPHSTTMAQDMTGGETLMVWTREYPSCIELRGRILNRYGYPLTAASDPSHAAPCVAGPAESSFVIATSTQASLDPVVVGLVDGWAVAYAESRFGTVDIATQVVEPSGELGFRWIANQTEGGPLIPGDQTTPRLVPYGSGYFVVWVDENIGGGGASQIWAREFAGMSDQNAPVGSPFIIASDPNASMSDLAVAGQGSSWAAAWLSSGAQNEIHLRRYLGNTPIDFEPVVVATNATTPELVMLSDGSIAAGYTTEYPFDAEVVWLGASSTAIDPVPIISFDDPEDPSERLLSLAVYDGALVIARVESNTATLDAISTADFAPMGTTPLEWGNVLAELASSFDTNVTLHGGTRDLWIGWSGIGAGTLNLGFSIHRLPPEFGP